jgi:hypothetical protein
MRKFLYLLMLFLADCKKLSKAVNTAKDKEDFDNILSNGENDGLQEKQETA